MKAAHLFIGILPIFLACSKTTSKRPSELLPPRTPVAAVIERVIAGPLLNQSLRNPNGLATDARGNIYLCDQGNNRIVELNKDLAAVRDRGGFGNQPGLFDDPRFVTVDNQLNVWVSDGRNRRIVRMDAELNFVDAIPFSDVSDPLKFGYPTGVTVTSFGSLWVADPDNDRVVLFDNVGQFDKFVGDFGATGGQLQDPEKIVVDNDEKFYVCDPGNRRVAIYDSYGTFQTALTDGAMQQPVAVTLDKRGTAWVLDQKARKVFCFDANGHNVAEGGLDLQSGSITPVAPSDLAFIGEDALLISDGGSNRLLVCKVIFK